MDRRDFLQYSSLAGGLIALPRGYRNWNGSLTPIPNADKKELADLALTAARARGASYADVRIGRYLNQSVSTRERRVQGISNSEAYGVGIRVLANDTWGFAATNDVTPDGVARTAERAVAIAKANAILQTEPVRLAPVPAYGEVILEDADPDQRDGDPDPGKGRPPDGGQRGRPQGGGAIHQFADRGGE